VASIVQTSLPSSEPVALADMINILKQPSTTADFAYIQTLITAARVHIENATGLMLAPRTYVQSLDCFPFYPYSREPYGQLYGVGALALYFGYGPILPTPIPPYGINQDGHLPFEIVLLGNPVTAIDHITYIGADMNPHTMVPGQDFIADLASFPARVVPFPGTVWPQCTLGANCVQIYFTSGFNQTPTATETVTETAGTTEESDNVPSPPEQQANALPAGAIVGIPLDLYVAITQLVAHWYSNREAVAGGQAVEVPHHLQEIINQNKVLDFSLGISATL
jgi:hypothetical protein